MVFPQTPLDTRIKLQVGGVWTDITSDVYTADRITIERGRPDEAQRTDPGKATLVFNNRLGKYSPGNPLSPYYGQIGRNTPVRIDVMTGTSYLDVPAGASDRASTPDAVPLDITGDIDVRVEVRLDDWQSQTAAQELIGKWGEATNQRSWVVFVFQRELWLYTSVDGTAEHQSRSGTKLTVPSSGRLALRCTLDVNDGAGGKVNAFYTAPTLDGPWTLLATSTVSGTTAIFNSTASLDIGAVGTARFTTMSGQVYRAEVRNGLGGTVVANPDFRPQTAGATSFADSAGRTWTLGGSAALTNRRTRFIGEISSWPSRWDVSGRDIRVPIEAAGVLRRYGQGQKSFDSTLRRRIPSYNPAAYWPFEEDQGATQAYSPIAGVRPMKVSGVTFASDDTLGGATAMPAWDAGAEGRGTLPTMTAGAWHLECVMRLDTMPASLNTLFEVATTGTAKKYTVRLQTNNVQVAALDDDGNVLSLINSTAPVFTGRWNRFQLWAKQVGGNVEMHVAWISVGSTGLSVTNTYAGTEGRPTSVRVMGVPTNLRLGHLAVFPTTNVAAFTAADDGFAGETTGDRLLRLSTEEGKPIAVYGETPAEELLGAQKPQTFMDLIEEAADVDGGILYERRDFVGLAYRDRISMYNQRPALALDYTAPGHIAPPLEPIDDDQQVRNDVTVTRTAGSSARAVLETGALSIQAPPNGVGVYDESLTLNLYNDDQPTAHAGWRLRLGTIDEPRYPVVNLDLAAAPGLAEAVTQLDCGDRVTIANPPPWLPPGMIDLIVQGYQETIGHPNHWNFTLNCTPAAPWNVAWLGEATTVRDPREFQWIDGDFSQLATALTDSAATVPLLTTSGPVWSGAVSDTPWDWRVSGEVMTVTAPGSLLNSNPFFNADASGWTAAGCAIGRSTAVVMPHPRAVASLLVTPDGVTAAGGASCTATAVGTINPAGSYVASMWVYSPGGHADLRPCVDWYDAAGTFLSTSLGSGTVVAAGVWTYIEQTLTAPANASRASAKARHAGTPAASAVYYVWGVRVTRTKASWLYDQTARSVSSGWGNTDSGQTWQRFGGTASDFNVGSGYASQILSTLDVSRRTAVDAIHPDADIYCDLTTSALATGDSLYGAICARMLDSGNMYLARVEFTTSNTVILAVRKIVADVQTTIGTFTLPRLTHAAGQWVSFRFQLQGTALRAKGWLAGTIEPGSWQIDVTDSAITAANQIGTRSIRSATSSNAATVEVRYRAFDVINPQVYPVARSANGIVKAQALAAPASLATPSYVAL
ncbi:hypothetical protein GFH48_19145 [Streptomyces fagopyri]|uniref:CBM-cenC domain-containing protein n=1 Tax=Streptomyces fagopyri TaxID=2662397 RepID=A0A5Q0LE33_9ACTN|nr:hypothetical protein [Streptomyces fagopyri]QFZ75104.1 hypothetical protein GFH48_19145 [Streptomyces fagopyri]